MRVGRIARPRCVPRPDRQPARRAAAGVPRRPPGPRRARGRRARVGHHRPSRRRDGRRRADPGAARRYRSCPGDDEDALHERIKAVEHVLLPQVVATLLAAPEAPPRPRRALLSVSDKAGLVALARGLDALGFELVSTGGTARALREAGLRVTDVAAVTGAAEMLDGRVKTLHPAIHGGLLADLRRADHEAQLRDAWIAPFEIVIGNLYPFEAAAARPDIALDDLIEEIDIGGPTLVRASCEEPRVRRRADTAGAVRARAGRASRDRRSGRGDPSAPGARGVRPDRALRRGDRGRARRALGRPRGRASSASSRSSNCATARTRTSARRCTGWTGPTPRRARSRPASARSRASRSRTTTSSTRRRRPRSRATCAARRARS